VPKVAAWLLPALAVASPAHAAAFDHSDFGALLRAHVTDDGLVDYDAFRADASFARYLDRLARADLAGLADAERLAFWINVYNAYTIQLINAHGERESIRNINNRMGLNSKGPWREPIVRAASQVYDLDHLEHQILRREFREPRIHFALVCGARGCPPLRREPYTGAALDGQLEDQARAFLLRSPERNRVDVPARTVLLSPIFDWYRDDFGGSRSAIGRYVAGFHPDGPEKALLLSGTFELKYTRYDWSLNGAPKARPPRRSGP
jgi:uncharacterized protein DUF547